MKVIANGQTIELGATEAQPTVGIIDYSRRVTDDFGITTVVRRGFSRRMSVRTEVPEGEVDALQRRLADLRATSALWVADERYSSLSFTGFYKDFQIDMASSSVSFCTLNVEGLVEADVGNDPGGDPAADGKVSTLRMVMPATITDAVLAASSVPEDDYPAWSSGATYAQGARVIRGHRCWESLTVANIGNEPTAASPDWTDIGPTNRWAMFDEALGTVTAAAGNIVITLDPIDDVNAVALLDVAAPLVRVQASGYDRSRAPVGSTVTFLDLPDTTDPITITIAAANGASVGTLLMGRMVGLGVTETSPSAGITDYSRKEVDDFGDVTVVERAWAKRMGVRALLRSSAADMVISRLASVRARPCLWIGAEDVETLSIYGFYKDFAVTIGENVSNLELTIEGLSKAAPVVPLSTPTQITVYRNGVTAPAAPGFDTGEVPPGWTLAPATLGTGQYRWSTQAQFLAGKQQSAWSDPVRIGGVNWTEIIDNDPERPKPSDGADKTSDNTSKDTLHLNGTPVEEVLNDLRLDNMNWFDLAALTQSRDEIMRLRTTLEGKPIGTVVSQFKAEQIEKNTAIVETIALQGAKSGDGTSFIWNVNTNMVTPTMSFGQYMQGVEGRFGDVEGSVTDLRTVMVSPTGDIQVKAVMALNANGHVVGTVQTNDGTIGEITFVFDRARFLKPDQTLMWGYDELRNAVVMPNVIVDTIEARTVKTETIDANSVTGMTSYGFPDVQVAGVTTIAEMTDLVIGDGLDGRAQVIVNFMQDGTSNIDTAMRIITYVDVGQGYQVIRNHVQGIAVSSGNARWVMPATFSIPILANGPVKFKVTAQPYSIPGAGTGNASWARNIQIDILEGFR